MKHNFKQFEIAGEDQEYVVALDDHGQLWVRSIYTDPDQYEDSNYRWCLLDDLTEESSNSKSKYEDDDGHLSPLKR